MRPAPSSGHVFTTQLEAAQAVQALLRAGFDAKTLSIVGKGQHANAPAAGFYAVGGGVRAWGNAGAFWSDMWASLGAPAVFVLPGMGVVVMAGQVGPTLIAGLQSDSASEGQSALAAAFIEFGLPTDEVSEFERAVQGNKYLVLLHASVHANAATTH